MLNTIASFVLCQSLLLFLLPLYVTMQGDLPCMPGLYNRLSVSCEIPCKVKQKSYAYSCLCPFHLICRIGYLMNDVSLFVR